MKRHGAAGVVSFAQENGKPLARPPERVREQKGIGSCHPDKTGLLTVASPVPHAQSQELGIESCELKLVSLALSFPQLSTRPWAPVPSHPWLCLQNPLGRWGGGTAGSEQRAPAQPSILHELSETDRHVGNSVHVGLGEAAGGQEGNCGCLLPSLLNPVEMTDPPTTPTPSVPQQCGFGNGTDLLQGANWKRLLC